MATRVSRMPKPEDEVEKRKIGRVSIVVRLTPTLNFSATAPFATTSSQPMQAQAAATIETPLVRTFLSCAMSRFLPSVSMESWPSPDLIRGLSRPSMSCLLRLNKKDVDARDDPRIKSGDGHDGGE